jgi:hypothetical protein
MPQADEQAGTVQKAHMRRIYIAADDTLFDDEEKCLEYEKELLRTVSVPVTVLAEAIRQCTPYMVTAAERRALSAKLKRYLPEPSPNSVLSENLTQDSVSQRTSTALEIPR